MCNDSSMCAHGSTRNTPFKLRQPAIQAILQFYFEMGSEFMHARTHADMHTHVHGTSLHMTSTILCSATFLSGKVWTPPQKKENPISAVIVPREEARRKMREEARKIKQAATGGCLAQAVEKGESAVAAAAQASERHAAEIATVSPSPSAGESTCMMRTEWEKVSVNACVNSCWNYQDVVCHCSRIHVRQRKDMDNGFHRRVILEIHACANIC